MAITIATLVGSLRANSVNGWVRDTLLPLHPDVQWSTVDLVPVPLYNQDLEDAGAPAPVVAMRSVVEAADALLIFTPEYNWSVPAVTKNAVDWLSRPLGEGPLVAKPVGIVAATPGRSGGPQVRDHLGQSLSVLTDRFYPDTHGVASINHVTEHGRITDPEALEALEGWMAGFLAHIAES